MRIVVLAVAAMAVLGGCATYGPRYERASSAGDFGYYDVRLDDNRYRVQYRVEGDRYVAEDFAMRRAAELTRSRGYDWFQVVNRSRAVSDDMFSRYDSYRYGAEQYRDRPSYGSGYDDDSVVVLDIVMGYNPPPGGSSVYDAHRLETYRSGDRRY